MGAPNPPFMPEPFANDATGTYRNTIPDTTVDAQRASYELGFPPQTMTAIIAGGKPMLGPDMNGILFALSAHLFSLQAGQLYPYNSDVSAAIGGYQKGALVSMADGTGVWQSLVNANTTDPDTTSDVNKWIPLYRYGQQTITSNGGIVTLTPQQASYDLIIINGGTVANVQLVLPPWNKSWLLVNSTSGAFPVTARTSDGGSVTLAPLGLEGPQGVYGATTISGTILYPR